MPPLPSISDLKELGENLKKMSDEYDKQNEQGNDAGKDEGKDKKKDKGKGKEDSKEDEQKHGMSQLGDMIAKDGSKDLEKKFDQFLKMCADTVKGAEPENKEGLEALSEKDSKSAEAKQDAPELEADSELEAGPDLDTPAPMNP